MADQGCAIAKSRWSQHPAVMLPTLRHFTLTGKIILVKNLTSGKDFRAQVTGKGLVTIGEPKGNDK